MLLTARQRSQLYSQLATMEHDDGALVGRLVRSSWMARVCRTELRFFPFGSAVGVGAVVVVCASALATEGLTPSHSP